MNEIASWPKWQKFLCVCYCTYTLLYILPFPFTYIGIFPQVGDFFNNYTWYKFIPWFGKTVLGIQEEIPFAPNSSGDRLYYWIKSLVLVIMGVMVAGMAIVRNPKQSMFQKLLLWTNLYVVYFLMGSMAVYGMVKVIKLQFSEPNLLTLLQEYGHFSPASMAWYFMGHSTIYTFFAGISEVTGAVLLLFRRTRILGAVVVFGVSLNVFMFDVSYDISVKLYSLHLTLYALYIALKDGRLLRLLLLNQPTQSKVLPDHFKNPKLNKIFFYAKVVLVGAFILWQFQKAMTRYNNRYDPNNIPALYGIYDVSHFEVNGDTVPPLATHPHRWRKLVIQDKKTGVVKPMYDNSNRFFQMELDTVDGKLLLTSRRDSTEVFDLTYHRVADSLLFLSGFWNKDTVAIHLKAYDLSQFKLLNTEVDWISDITKF